MYQSLEVILEMFPLLTCWHELMQPNSQSKNRQCLKICYTWYNNIFYTNCLPVLTSANWMMKCLRWASEKTESTYSPGLPWLSRTRKSPSCLSSSWASVRGIAPWYHSCSPNGFSLMGITSMNSGGIGGTESRKWVNGYMSFFFNFLLIIKSIRKEQCIPILFM